MLGPRSWTAAISVQTIGIIDVADNTAAKLPAHKRDDLKFKPGQSGNPSGRPKGSKNALQEAFINDVKDAWEAKGAKAIADMIEKNPGDFVKMCAGLMPKDVTLNFNDRNEMTDDELIASIRSLTATISPFLTSGIGGATEGTDGAAVAQKSAIVH